jgi:hypothetical protein
VIITDKGEPAYVLLRHDLNCRLVGEDPTILELLAQPGGEDLDFDLPRPPSGIFRPGDLS